MKTHPIIKTKVKVELNPESIALIKVQAPRDIIGNRKYQLNLEGYLPQGIIPFDLVHSFDKMLRTLYIPILNTSSKYESIGKGSLLGMFEPIDEEVGEVQVTSWTDLEGKMRKAHQQLRKKKSFRQARQKCCNEKEEPVELLQVTSWTDLEGKMRKAHQQLRKKKSFRQARQKCCNEKEEPVELLPDYPANSNMEMEAMMKRSDTKLGDAIDADRWKTKVSNMLESRFGSIISKS